MSEEETKKTPWWNRPVFGSGRANPSGRRSWRRRDTIGLILIILVIDFLGGGNLLLFLGTLALGWIGFLKRVAPEWRSGSGALISGVITTLIFLVVLHRCCQWWRRQQGWTWTWAGSLRLAITVVVAFATGVCAVGIIHQSAWIGREGIYESSSTWRFRSYLHALRAAARSEPGDLQRAIQNLQADFPDCEVVFPDPDQQTPLLVSDPESAQQTWILVDLGSAESVIISHPASLAESVQASRLGILVPGVATGPGATTPDR